MFNPFLSVAPALLTMLVAFCTKDVIKALLSGIFSACIITTSGNLWEIPQLLFGKLSTVFEADKLLSLNTFFNSERILIFGFLIILGTQIAMIMRSGSANAYLNFVSKFANTRSRVQLSSLGLSFLLFIDDYLSVIMTSCIMPKLTDRLGVPRVRLAFLITALAAPLCALIPISSWAAVITLFIADAGVSMGSNCVIAVDSFYALLQAIPMMFYCILSILCAWVVAYFDLDFCSSRPKESPISPILGESCKGVCVKSNASFFDFVFPLVSTISIILVSLLHTGKFFSHFDLLRALAQNNAPQGLFFGSLAALVISILFYCAKGLISFRDLGSLFWEGFLSMKDSVIILTLSAILSEFLKGELGTCRIISEALLPYISNQFLPLSFFVICAIISFAIGSSWATMSVIFPIATSVCAGTANPGLIIAPVFGAILSGVIFGSSLSPMSDLITITSRNTGVDILQYVKNQFLYLSAPAVGSIIAFLVVSNCLARSYALAFAGSLGLGVLVMLAQLYFLCQIKRGCNVKS